MKDSKLSHQERMKREDLITYLEDLTRSIRDGRIVIEKSGRFLSLVLPSTVQMELEAKTKKDKGELSIEISWKNEIEVPSSSVLRISSVEPEIAAVEEPFEDAAETQNEDENLDKDE